jgi:octaprenyl-diphosphate synthase
MADLNEIRKPLADEWQRFEALLDTAFDSPDALLQSALNHVAKSKGKQLRPTLTLLSAQVAGQINARTHLAAASFEVLHTASLLHDDVVDCTDQRRGLPSVNARYGNQTAVLVGDYLLTKSMGFMSRTESMDLMRCLVELGKDTTRGELLQQQNAFTLADESVYYEIIRLKTASLFAHCALAGALSAGATPEKVDALQHFGENLGICFQIKDDIFDYTPQANIGKPTLNDLREGKFTLPIIQAIKNADETAKKRIVDIAKNADEIAKNGTWVQQFVLQNGGIDYANEKMDYFRAKALDCLAIFPENNARNALAALLDFALERNN